MLPYINKNIKFKKSINNTKKIKIFQVKLCPVNSDMNTW